MIDYAYLKDAAKRIRRAMGVKLRVDDLIALSSKNDPFYCGAPSQRRDAEWFAAIYPKVAGGDAHLRRIHYRILDLTEDERRLPLKLTTKVTGSDGRKRKIEFTHYENFDRCWAWLTEAAKAARYLGLVPVGEFVDNRAKESSFSFYTRWSHPDDLDYIDPEPGYEVRGDDWERYLYELPDLPKLDGLPSALEALPYLWTTGYDGLQQPYHIEIWAEKSEGEDVFDPLCRRYGVNFVPGVGDMSITTTYRFCERVRRADRPAKLLYISDFDPSGFNMPVAVGRKLEHFCREHGFDDLDITLEPLLLTEQQVIDYALPPAPVKDSDARKDEWEAQFGGAVELNAMFAREERKEAARQIIEQAILRYYDTGLDRKIRKAKGDLQYELDEARDEVTESYQTEWDALTSDYDALLSDFETLRDEFDELVQPFREKLDQFKSRLDDINDRGEEIYRAVAGDLDRVDIDLDDHPLPDIKEVSTAGALYHSRRDYWEQLRHYYAHRSNGDGPPKWLDYLPLEGLL